MARQVTEQNYNTLKMVSPENRVAPSGDELGDKIAGILFLFGKHWDMRSGHFDIITLRDAECEIRNLIREEKAKDMEEMYRS